jgi:NhaA family Na+:H+ antiporter
MRGLARISSFIIDNSLLLVAGTVTALVWANVDHASYNEFALSMRFVVNDIGMAFFFAVATKEIVEAMLPGGPLASPREAAVPVLAALAGMAVPASLFILQASFDGRPELMRGWAIPCATDIAFSYMTARLIFPREHAAIPFLLLLAIADDALGLIVLAVAYPSGPLSVAGFAFFMIPALGLAWTFKRKGVASFWPYVIVAGGLSWAALHVGGIHPALALVPIVPWMPHAARDLGILDPREDSLPDTMNRFEHSWRIPVQVILFFFGLANAGVQLSRVGPVTWMVLSSLVIGKPLGIVTVTLLAPRLGLLRPAELGPPQTLVVGVAAGIGFTVALFFATAAFPPGELLDESKMGALLSFVGAPIAYLLGLAIARRRTDS